MKWLSQRLFFIRRLQLTWRGSLCRYPVELGFHQTEVSSCRLLQWHWCTPQGDIHFPAVDSFTVTLARGANRVLSHTQGNPRVQFNVVPGTIFNHAAQILGFLFPSHAFIPCDLKLNFSLCYILSIFLLVLVGLPLLDCQQYVCCH